MTTHHNIAPVRDHWPCWACEGTGIWRGTFDTPKCWQCHGLGWRDESKRLKAYWRLLLDPPDDLLEQEPVTPSESPTLDDSCATPLGLCDGTCNRPHTRREWIRERKAKERRDERYRDIPF